MVFLNDTLKGSGNERKTHHVQNCATWQLSLEIDKSLLTANISAIVNILQMSQRLQALVVDDQTERLRIADNDASYYLIFYLDFDC